MCPCPRCQGYLIRDYNIEVYTHMKPSYRCVNCGRYLDMRIMMNSVLTVEQKQVVAHREKYKPYHNLEGYREKI